MSDVASVFVAVLSAAILLGSAIAVLRSRSLQTDMDLIRQNMDTFRAANQELRADNDALRAALHSEQSSCREALAELRGEVKVLRGTIVDGLVGSIRAAMSDAIHEALTRPERRDIG